MKKKKHIHTWKVVQDKSIPEDTTMQRCLCGAWKETRTEKGKAEPLVIYYHNKFIEKTP